jgi:hypothetical protein
MSPRPSLFPEFSLLPLDLTLLTLFTAISPKTEDKLTELTQELVTNTVPNLGVLVELLLVFPEFLDQEPTEVDKVLSVINAEKVECSPP